MELVDHMGPLRVMQPAGPVESVDSCSSRLWIKVSTLDIGAGVSKQMGG